MIKQLLTFFSVIMTLAASVVSKEMQFSTAIMGGNARCSDWIVADGEITKDTPQKFIEFSEEIGLIDYCSVVFNSEGGNITAAVVLGTIIRENGLSTSVGKTVTGEDGYPEIERGLCLSACAYAFMGGIERNASAGEIGVHQFYGDTTGNDLENSQAFAGMLIFYLDDLGIDLRAMKSALMTPSEEMYFYTKKELEEFLIVTYHASGFEPWLLETNGSGLIASAKYTFDQETDYNVALYCKEPSSKLRLLFSKKANKFPWRNNFDFEDDAANLAKNGIFHLNGDRVFLQERHFNFLRIENNKLFLSFYIPGQLLYETDELGGLSFSLNSTTGWGSQGMELVFGVRGNLPNKEILQVLKKNCVG